MLTRAAATVAIWTSFAISAHAETLEGDRKKMADMLVHAGAANAFVNETTEQGTLTARHRPTGMKCRFIMGLGRLSYDAETGNATCVMRRSTYTYGLAAVRTAPGETVEAALEGVVASAAQGRKARDLSTNPAAGLIPAAPKSPQPVTRHFRVGKEYWRASAVRVGDWFVVMQTMSLTPGNLMATLQQDIEWRETLESMQAAGGDATE